MTDGMTKKARMCQLLDSGLSRKTDKYANQLIVNVELLWRDTEGYWKTSNAKLPRKVSRVNHIGTRTENRHRWSRRVS